MSSAKYGETSARRSLAHLSIFGTTQLHLRNPFVIACWSMIFPGMGHLLLSKYVRGFGLFVWEVFINSKANINLLILYSFLGDFEQGKQVVDTRWLLLYIPTYIFAIWDSYRTTVDINHAYILASREDAEIKPFKIGAFEINYLDNRKPWISVIWSLLSPGVGQLYIHRLTVATFVVIWWIIICYYSRLLPAVHYTFLGDFQQAKAVLDIHWFLNVPSVYFFALYDSYTNTVENNKLFEWEQSKFLKRKFQNPDFKMPSQQYRGGDKMYIVSTFDQSIYLELALTAIQMKGIKEENIIAIPLDKKGEAVRLFDSLHSSDGLSLLDLPAILGTFFGILGSIYGFVLKWGPLFWGLIGIVIGFALGLLIKLKISRKYKGRQKDRRGAEVVVIVRCFENQLEMVSDILWSHHALGVRKLDMN